MFNEDALDGPTADRHLPTCHGHCSLHRGSHCLEGCRHRSGLVGWAAPCPQLWANRARRQKLPWGFQHSPLAREVREVSVPSGFFTVFAFTRGPAAL